MVYWQNWPTENEASEPVDYIVLKAHHEPNLEIITELASLFDITIFTAMRPGEQVANSWHRVADENPTPILISGVQIYRKLMTVNQAGWNIHVTSEADARNGSKEALSQIFQAAEFTLSQQQISQVLQENTVEENINKIQKISKARGLVKFGGQADYETLWHMNHVSKGNSKKVIWDFETQKAIDEFDAAAADFLKNKQEHKSTPTGLTPEQFLKSYLVKQSNLFKLERARAVDRIDEKYKELLASRSWKITAPLRAGFRFLTSLARFFTSGKYKSDQY